MNDIPPHPNSEIAFSGLEKDYETARPNYPEAALEYILRLCPAPEPALVVDIGCGTGKLTRQLVDMYREARMIGCDANADMVNQARASTPGGSVDYLVSMAETLPFTEHEVGLLTAAQAVQWFDRPAFFAEAQRVLAPKGVLVLLENNRDWRNSALLDAYESLLEANAPGYSRHYRDHDYAAELTAAGFSDVNIHTVSWVREMKVGLFVQMARSSTRLQAALRVKGESVISDLENLLHSNETANGLVVVPYATQVFSAVA